MEDDHVDRTGVEARQLVKLTVTNSSIGLIVLIVHVHQKRKTLFRLFCPHALTALRTARRKVGDARSCLRSFASKVPKSIEISLHIHSVTTNSLAKTIRY